MLATGGLDLRLVADQLAQMKRMGGMEGMMGLLPGVPVGEGLLQEGLIGALPEGAGPIELREQPLIGHLGRAGVERHRVPRLAEGSDQRRGVVRASGFHRQQDLDLPEVQPRVVPGVHHVDDVRAAADVLEPVTLRGGDHAAVPSRRPTRHVVRAAAR